MERVFHPPVTANCLRKVLGITGQTADVVASFPFNFAINAAFYLNHANASELHPLVSVDQKFHLSYRPGSTNFHPSMPLVYGLVKIMGEPNKVLGLRVSKDLLNIFKYRSVER
jgi:hypothetical protein